MGFCKKAARQQVGVDVASTVHVLELIPPLGLFEAAHSHTHEHTAMRMQTSGDMTCRLTATCCSHACLALSCQNKLGFCGHHHKHTHSILYSTALTV